MPFQYIRDIWKAVADFVRLRLKENATLKERVRTLEAEKRARMAMQYDDKEEVYWRCQDPEHKDGPFCKNCYESAGKDVRLVDGPRRGTHLRWYCTACNGQYGALVIRPPQPPERRVVGQIGD
jgi:RNase P subunit RPR2